MTESQNIAFERAYQKTTLCIDNVEKFAKKYGILLYAMQKNITSKSVLNVSRKSHLINYLE